MNTNSSKKPSLFDNFLDEIDNEIEYCDISNDENSIGEISVERDSIIELQSTNFDESNSNRNFNMLVGIDDAFETIHGDSEVSLIQIQQTSEELQTNCLSLINKSKSQKDSKNESKTTINKLQSQIALLNLQLKQQSTLSSMIGSVFGSYLWKATTMPVVVDLILEKNKIVKMADLITTVLSSFIETYNNNMPSVKTYETKFILNILGIIANLTTKKAGCLFFSQVNDGIKVIDLIISLVICIPSSLENNLKKIAYAVLYNVSIQFNGHLLMENNKLIQVLHNDIKTLPDKNINDTLIFALKLLHSLTRNINESMYIILKNEIKLEEILKLTRCMKTELIARKIYENINAASAEYNDTFE